jgi:hypothetical protein
MYRHLPIPYCGATSALPKYFVSGTAIGCYLSLFQSSMALGAAHTTPLRQKDKADYYKSERPR